MYKYLYSICSCRAESRMILKYLLIMKLSFVLMVTTFLQVAIASDSYSQKISLSKTNTSLLNVFKEIRKQSGYDFFYTTSLISEAKPVSIYVKDAELTKVLEICFAGQPFTYSVENKTIVVNPKETSSDKEQIVLVTVTGKVTDIKGQPLIGVSVRIKGSGTGTSTDLNGNFNINTPDDNSVLVFTYIGFVAQEVTVNGRTSVNVVLQESTAALSEVVVTALGIKREAKSLGYSASTVDMDQLGNTRATNFGNSLQGKVAGVNVSPPASGPGGSSKIRIRGQSSFGANNSPLIVVNGVPINNATETGRGRSDGGDGLQSINQDDIASMTVLKGAAASALYGFRAKDGAIIITTKSGSSGAGIGVEFNSNFQSSEPLDYTDFQYEYGQGENGKRQASFAEAKGSGTWNFGEKFDGVMTPQFDGEMRPYSPSRDKISNFYRNGAAFTNSLALSGGNEKGNFRLSFANTDADAIIENSDLNKKIVNLGLNYNVSDKLSVQLNANYSNEITRNPPQFSIEAMNPNTTIYLLNNSINVDWIRNFYKTPAGIEAQLSRFPEWSNPYWVVNERFENVNRDRVFGNATVRYEFNDWLYAQGRIGQDYFTRPYDYNIPTGTLTGTQAITGFNGRYYQGAGTFRERNLDFILGLNRTYGKFRFDVNAGGNQMEQVNTNIFTDVTNFFIKPLYTVANGQVKNPGYSYTKKRVNSFFGSAEIAFKNYLYLNITARNDWFSTLNPASNSYLYPSISTSFILTDAFAMPAWMDYGKFRAAYAEVGSDTDPYSQSNYYTLQANPFNGAALSALGNISPNPNLKPLKVKELEAGLEFQMFSRRLKLDFSAYRKNTIDEILNVDISNTSGYNQTVVNVGKLRNQGVELLLSVTPIKRDFEWETSFNGSYNISEVLELADNQSVFNVGTGPWYGWLSHEVGQPLASVRGYDYKRDAQGRILTTSGKFLQGNIINYGSAIPKWVGSWINNFKYKKFQLYSQIDFKAGSKLLSNSNMNFLRTGQTKSSLVGRENGVVFPRFNQDGTANTVAVPAQEFYTTYRSTLLATPFIYDASFIRWRALSLEYDATKFFAKTFMKTVIISANVSNLLMIKKHVDNLDPEAQGSVSDNLQGIEVHTLPTTRNYGLNLNIKL